jgi:hypothetical protein
MLTEKQADTILTALAFARDKVGNYDYAAGKRTDEAIAAAYKMRCERLADIADAREAVVAEKQAAKAGGTHADNPH